VYGLRGDESLSVGVVVCRATAWLHYDFMVEALQTHSLDELLYRYESEPDREVASQCAAEARRKAGFHDRWPQRSMLALPEELDATQRRVAEHFTRRTDVEFGGFGLPTSQRRLRQWLGIDPPSILDQRIAFTHEGVELSGPLWKVWTTLDPLHNRGFPAHFVVLLTPVECVLFAIEALLEHEACFMLDDRVRAILDDHGAEVAERIGELVDVLVSLRSPEGPYAHRHTIGYRRLSLYEWDQLAILTLLPLVRVGASLNPSWDTLAPFTGPNELVREILKALPAERREAVIYHRLTRDWGHHPEKVLNGFDDGLALLDLAPSERVARIVVAKYRHNRRFFARSKEKILARFDALAAVHPGVARALKPQRVAKRDDVSATRTTMRKSSRGAKKPAEERPTSSRRKPPR